MIGLETVLRYLWWLVIAGHVVAVVRLRSEGLHRVYRFFYWYLILWIAFSGLMEAVPRLVQAVRGQTYVPFFTNAYAYIWFASRPVMWVCYILMVLEVYSLVLQKYKGIASLSRWVLSFSVAASLGISSLTLGADLGSRAADIPMIRYCLVIDRGMHSSLVVFLLLIAVFLAWYPVPLNRNIIAHCLVFAVYFLAVSLVLFARNVFGKDLTPLSNVLLLGIVLGCVAAWSVFLTRRGEAIARVPRRQWVPGEEERLVEHLAAINASLLRVARDK